MPTTLTPDAQNRLARIAARIAPLEARLNAHPLYAAIASLDDVRVFMQHHIFAVWDFMSLLKALQRDLTCTTVPWTPTAHPRTRRFINAIVLEEESDEVDGETFSHYELYRRAMLDIGADPGPCDRAMARLTLMTVKEAFAADDIPGPARRFVEATFAFIATGKPHIVAAAFTHGREDPIPEMFRALLKSLDRPDGRLDTLKLYLERHIDLDEGEHGPMAEAMLVELCADDDRLWQEASDTAAAAVAARLALWDGVVAAINSSRETSAPEASGKRRTRKAVNEALP